MYLIILAVGLLGIPFGAVESRGDSLETRESAFVPGQVIIRFQSDVTQRLRTVDARDVHWLERRFPAFDTVAQKLGIEIIRPVSDELRAESGPVAAKLDDFFVARFRDGVDPEKAASLLEQLPGVRSAQPNVAYPEAMPETDLPTLIGRRTAFSRMNVSSIHSRTRGDPATRIAILDTGLDTTGTRGLLNMVDGYDLVDIDTAAWARQGYRLDTREDYVERGTLALGRTGHGSILTRAVAGPDGICPNCSVMPLRAGFLAKYPGDRPESPTVARFEADDISAALVHATNQEADIINMSLTVGAPSDVLALGINYAYRRDVLLVAAAGNQGRPRLPYPAAYGQVVAVGAADERGERASFSNYGKGLELMAPGVDVRPDAYGMHIVRGTSLSAAYVSGIAGLIHSVDPTLDGPAIRTLLRDSAQRSPPPASFAPTLRHGYGRVDGRGAVLGAEEP